MSKNTKTRPGQRDPIEELIKHELVKIYEILNALEYLELVDASPKGYLSESDGWCWFESKPPREEKLRVLEHLNYNISGL